MKTALSVQIEEIGKRLDRIEPDIKHYFLETGANDGIKQSNSIELENLGWDGILIEPSPVAFELLNKNRKCTYKFQCAVGDGQKHKAVGSFTDGSLMGSCDSQYMKRDIYKGKVTKILNKLPGRISKHLQFIKRPKLTEVALQSISEVIRETSIKKIDIMTLDIEGFELFALRGISACDDPRIIAIETHSRDSLQISDLLLSKNYILLKNLSSFTLQNNPQWSEDQQDYLWVKRSDNNAISACEFNKIEGQ